MTSLSQYLRAEQIDTTEPASFYAPGALGWDDMHFRLLRARALRAAQIEGEVFNGAAGYDE